MNQTRDIMYCLMRSLCYGMSFSQAVNHIHDYSDIWTLEYKAFCYRNPYTFNNTSEDNVFLIDPHPFDLQNTVNNNIVTVSWKNPQTAGDYRYRVKIYRDGVSERWYKPQTTRGVTISDLEPGTYSWLVQADLYYDGKMFESYTTDGEPFTIKQTSQGNDDPTPEAIDLGLSVKWASFNLGASKPEEYGDYFAWGEMEPYYEPGYAQSDNPVWKAGKSGGYDWSSYKWCNGSEITLAKYNVDDSFGTVDNKTVLDTENDAAHVNWGGSWRMPTDKECEELMSECTWTWTSENGVDGEKVTGPNGNSIFLPAAGYRLGTGLYSAGAKGFYWSSSLNTGFPPGAYFVFFYSDDVFRYHGERCGGHSVRPVSE